MSALGSNSYERKYSPNHNASDSQSNLTEEPLCLDKVINELTVLKVLRSIVLSLLYTCTALAIVLLGLLFILIFLSSCSVNSTKEIIKLSPLGFV